MLSADSLPRDVAVAGNSNSEGPILRFCRLESNRLLISGAPTPIWLRTTGIAAAPSHGIAAEQEDMFNLFRPGAESELDLGMMTLSADWSDMRVDNSAIEIGARFAQAAMDFAPVLAFLLALPGEFDGIR